VSPRLTVTACKLRPLPPRIPPESLLRHDCSAALVDGLVLSAPRQLPMSGGFQLLVGCRLNQHAYAQLAIYFEMTSKPSNAGSCAAFRPSGN